MGALNLDEKFSSRLQKRHGRRKSDVDRGKSNYRGGRFVAYCYCPADRLLLSADHDRQILHSRNQRTETNPTGDVDELIHRHGGGSRICISRSSRSKKTLPVEKIIATGYDDVEAFIINMISALSTHRIALGNFLCLYSHDCLALL